MAGTEGKWQGSEDKSFFSKMFGLFLILFLINLNEVSHFEYFQVVIHFSVSTTKMYGRDFNPYFRRHLLTV